MKNVSKKKVQRYLGDGSEAVVGTFIKFYCEDKEEVAQFFVKEYNELCEAFMNPLLELEEFEFEEYPEPISEQCVTIEDDGVYISLGYLAMEVYGYDIPDIWEYDCVEKAIKRVLKQFGKLEYEGVITLIDESSRYHSTDGTVGSSIVGNRSDYKYTFDRISRVVLGKMANNNIYSISSLDITTILTLWDDDAFMEKKEEIKKAVYFWYKFHKNEYDFALLNGKLCEYNDENDENLSCDEFIVKTILDEKYSCDLYKIILLESCVEISLPATKKYLFDNIKKINKLFNEHSEEKDKFKEILAKAYDDEKMSVLKAIN